jgi:hypothetical protein
MKLEQNGKSSLGKRTQDFNIKLLYITYQIESKEVVIKYCPTDDRMADCMTKPLTASKFHKFRKQIMNIQDFHFYNRSVLDSDIGYKEDVSTGEHLVEKDVGTSGYLVP